MENQKTISREIELKEDIGIHTAGKVRVKFKPAEQDAGINFIRTDLPGGPVIKACVGSLLFQDRTPRRTSIGRDNIEIQTVEHLMAALSGLGIDNINVEIDNAELPRLDGSIQNFVQTLRKAGIKDQPGERRYFSLREPVFVEEAGISIVALPCKDFKISYTLDYGHPQLGLQFMEINCSNHEFVEEIAAARTFCLEEEAQGLQAQGLGKGANHENTLVVGKSGVIKNKLRYKDEFIRHKIADLLGDLNVLGYPIKAHIIALRSGHSQNLKLIRKIDSQKNKYTVSMSGAAFALKGEGELGIEEIKKILPHRQPFLFVDRITTLEEGKRAVGIKNVRADDYYFKGHFPGKPVMPGVLIIEAMAQVGGVMMLSPKESRGKIAYFMAANNIKFRRVVEPGSKLVLEVTAGKIKSRTGQVSARALVEGKVVAEAELMFALAK
ncbi:UDP-3-O-acyl-N-acetylglucosamine deacetylase [Candidatus Omnitrophota bacterium]